MSIRSAINAVRKNLPNEIMEVDSKVSINYEMTAYAEVLSAVSPMLLFNNIAGFPGFKVVSNMFSSRSKIAAY
ncbi:MAG: hypothetical protein ACP5NC_08475, partial [Nitrososphaeria archaeon]